MSGPLERAADDLLAFWAQEAGQLHWDTGWDQVLDWTDVPFARWFTGGRLNVAYNCVDRHVEAGHGAQVAFHWEGEPGDTRTITYAELRREVCRTANALLCLALTPGDRVAIQLPSGRRTPPWQGCPGSPGGRRPNRRPAPASIPS